MLTIGSVHAILRILRFKGITLATVDTMTDKVVLPQTWPNVNIPEEFYVDLQHLYRLPGNDRVGMSVMAADLIDPWYVDMKKNFPYQAHSRFSVTLQSFSFAFSFYTKLFYSLLT